MLEPHAEGLNPTLYRHVVEKTGHAEKGVRDDGILPIEEDEAVVLQDDVSPLKVLLDEGCGNAKRLQLLEFLAEGRQYAGELGELPRCQSCGKADVPRVRRSDNVGQ